MKLRIIIGKKLNGSFPGSGLKTLHRGPGLLIQGDEDVTVIETEQGGRAFLLGHVIGLHTPSGRMERSSGSPREAIREVLTEGPGRWSDLLEGRYVLAAVTGKGTGAVTTDRFGQMELFVQDAGGSTILASELALLALDGRVTYDQAALAHLLCVYGYRPPKPHTLYQGVRRLGLGQWVAIADGTAASHTIPFTPVRTGAYGERELGEYADTLLDAVEARGSRRGNVVYLSSGWDSTALLACLVKLFGHRKVRGVIGRMQYAHRSGVINQFELDRARAMADYFNIRLDVAELDFRDKASELVERVTPLFRGHQLYSFTGLNHAILAETAARTSDGNEVVFAGEVSDGAHNLGFSQFVTIFHPSLEFREYSDKMASYLFGPTFFQLFMTGRFADDPVYQLLRGRCGSALFDELARDEVGRRMQLLASFFLRGTRLPLWSVRNSRMLTPAGCRLYSEEMESVCLKEAADRLTPETLYAWYLRLYNSFHWQGSTVATMAVTAQAQGLRAELPFWDSRLQEFLSAMPESWGRGLDLHPTKYPLKWALEHRIDYPLHLQVGPHSYLYDVDPSFSHGAEQIYGSAFTPYLKSLLRKRPYWAILSPEVFSEEYLDQMVDRYLDGVEVRGAELNDLISLCTLVMFGWYGAPRGRPAGTRRSRAVVKAGGR